MKKILMGACLCTWLCGVVAIGHAYGATKCVALNSSTTCKKITWERGKLDWGASCTTGDTTVEISGIAVCASQGGNQGDKSDSLTTSQTSDNNKYCWCKLISPAVSPWVLFDSGGSAGTCLYDCAQACAGMLASSVYAPAVLFSDLRD